MTAVEVAQSILTLIIALFLLRVLQRYLEDRNPGSVTAGALAFLIGA